MRAVEQLATTQDVTPLSLGKPIRLVIADDERDTVMTLGILLRSEGFDVELVHDFLLALTNQVGMNLHVNMISGRNPHHIVEASFKGLARALSQAASYDPRVRGVLSTKGIL